MNDIGTGSHIEPWPTEQAESPDRTVTSRRPGTPAAERKRQQRARERAAALMWETADWQLFLEASTLPQKLGCQLDETRPLTVRELADNGLDNGGNVTLRRDGDTIIISDDGPGIDPAQIPELFAVRRPLLSSKRKRLPLRGMLGNGLRGCMGAVYVSGGSISVESRGRRLALAVDPGTGLTKVVTDETGEPRPGTTVYLTLGDGLPKNWKIADAKWAEDAIIIAKHGEPYAGRSSPWWYSERDFLHLMQRVTPPDTTVGRVCAELGFNVADSTPAREITDSEIADLLKRLRDDAAPAPPQKLGAIGRDILGHDACYTVSSGAVRHGDALIPHIVEAWAICEKPSNKGARTASLRLLLNRTPSTGKLYAGDAGGGRIDVQGCGLYRTISGIGAGRYDVLVSVITPYVELTSDGKQPALQRFSTAIYDVIRKACNAAHRAMEKPQRKMSLRDAAWQVMREAYLTASGGGRLPARPRQIMYAARPAILALTGKEQFGDNYFTQNLLPDYAEEHPDETADWDIVWDARGHIREPHTGLEIPIGTLEIRRYIGQRPRPPASELKLSPGDAFDTIGPEFRYGNVLFIEKEGFDPLLTHVRLPDRFDVAVMSTKGMSVTAARELVDWLAGRGVKILVAHDFDLSGFSIFGTLGTSGRRYTFRNKPNVIDIGLRLADIEAMGLESEPVAISGDWSKRANTLQEHGATREEISFLANRRVELNAMPSDVFVDFLERKLVEHGVHKVVPPDDVLIQHAKDVITRAITNKALEKIRSAAETDAAAIELPDDLPEQVFAALEEDPEIPWDLAVANIARDAIDEQGEP